MGSGSELWGFVLWCDRGTPVRGGRTAATIARGEALTVVIEVGSVDPLPSGGRVASR